MSPSFGIAFYHASGKAKNLSGDDAAKFAAYYRCILVTLASVRRCYPDSKLFLFTDRDLPETFNSVLRDLVAATEITSGRLAIDPRFCNEFPGCIFTLDVMHSLNSRHGDYICLLDPDVLTRRPLGEIGTGFAALPVIMNLHRTMQDQSRASLSMLAAMCGTPNAQLPITYYGGEFYGIPTRRASELSIRIERVLENAHVLRDDTGKLQFTEEHILSVALSDLEPEDASKLIKRLWTRPSFYNWEAGDVHIPMWHLPGEKNGLFAALAPQASAIARMKDQEFDALLTSTFDPIPPYSRRFGSKIKRKALAVGKALADTY